MSDRVVISGLQIAAPLERFVAEEALTGSDISPEAFWEGLRGLVEDVTPRLTGLLTWRDELQRHLDAWHRQRPGIPDPTDYQAFLREIGYLHNEPEPFEIAGEGVDEEIARVAGPQLVVPLLNPRFAINAANARWGSLYDALYGTDAIPGDQTATYDSTRGALVIEWARSFLDTAIPLVAGSHADSRRYAISDGRLIVELADGTVTTTTDPAALAGHTGDSSHPESVLLRHHGLHIDIAFDRRHPVGADDPAGISDVVLESAVTTIMDLEDAVAAVDAEDKVTGYRTWLGLNRGDIETEVTKAGTSFMRRLAADRVYTGADGRELRLPGRSLMFVRHVGHHMFTDAVLDRDGREIPEGILDALVTALCALPDLRRDEPLNSRTRSMYVVKPKLHGPEEVAVAVDVFAAVERILGLPDRTIKIGIMDEERRTSANLSACIREARDRVVFINTGFLDRTGDEIHTSMYAGAFPPKGALRSAAFLAAYEDRNVEAGLAAGFAGHAQIGKGMWAMPAQMLGMLEQKASQPRAGASTAWVPSPVAATLHAVHYHEVDVVAHQRDVALRPRTPVGAILDIPLADQRIWESVDVRHEVDTNIQSILGYVVRWVDQGIGCSTVPDLADVGLMEDRATLRISSQLLANWLLHGVIDEAALDESLDRISSVVDAQNANEEGYKALIGPDGPGLAYRAARELVFAGIRQANGYTEPILHQARRDKKAVTATAR